MEGLFGAGVGVGTGQEILAQLQGVLDFSRRTVAIEGF